MCTLFRGNINEPFHYENCIKFNPQIFYNNFTKKIQQNLYIRQP